MHGEPGVGKSLMAAAIIEVMEPQGNDAPEIIRHYLQNKNVASDVDPKLIAHIMDGRSCAEPETVVNAAGMYAGFERAKTITMEHLPEACLRIVFEVPTKAEDGDDNICCAKLLDANCESSQIVYHEGDLGFEHRIPGEGSAGVG